jgi:predicted nucleic acid-binding protein
MTFDTIPAGTAVFIDANIFIYAVTADPRYGPTCEKLLQRVENKEITGYTSSHVLAEMAHRLMTIEAASSLGRSLSGMANWLKRHPAEVRQLSRYRQAIDDLAAVPITILPVTGSHVSLAADLSRQHDLLTNDALVVVVMQGNGLVHLASLDGDFDRVPGIIRYTPV